jgi:hypothetical protein
VVDILSCQYCDSQVNHSLLSSWPPDFIPSQISASISYVDGSDHSELEGWVADLEDDNFENDFQAAVDNTSSGDGGILFKSIDVNGERLNCDLQLLVS